MDNENQFSIWCHHHWHDALTSLSNIWHRPAQTWPTIALFAMALSLPMMLLMSITHLENLSQHWTSQQQITLYLKTLPSTEEIHQIEQNKFVQSLEFISSKQALENFEKRTGIQHLSELLTENPLPPQLNLTLSSTGTYLEIKQLADELDKLHYVEEILVDFEWLQKTKRFLHIAHLTMIGLGLLLGSTIVLVIYNTTRLSIEENRQTILVSKLIGATLPFIRRPFLYLGFWQGFLGSICAWILVIGFDKLIYSPLKGLFALNQGILTHQGLTWLVSIELLLLGGLLGLTGAWFSVNQYIHRIDVQP